MSNFPNREVFMAAEARAVVNLIPSAETHEERAAAGADAVRLLGDAMRACILAGRHDVASDVMGAQQQMKGGA